MTVNRLLRSSKAIVLNLSSTLILAKHKSLSKYLLTTRKNDNLTSHQVNHYAQMTLVDKNYLPWSFVFAICVSLHVCLREPVVPQFNALLNRILNFKHVYRCFVRGASDDMQGRMENDVLNDGVTRTSAQGLQSFSSICRENFDYCATHGCWSNQCSIRVNWNCAEVGLMSLDDTVHAVVSNYKKQHSPISYS